MNKYKISLRVKKPIPKIYFTTILGNYTHYFNTASNCYIVLENESIIHYLDIYLNDLNTYLSIQQIRAESFCYQIQPYRRSMAISLSFSHLPRFLRSRAWL